MAEYGFRRWIITITVIVASLLELIDTTIVNVALPNIMGNLGATLEDANWIVTGYAVANVIILPMSGWLGDRFGRKNYFLTSIIVFTFASFLCGNAHSLTELIAFRLLQGLAGGGLISTAQAILLETWPPAEVGMATALFGLGAVVGPTVGPTIGGLITDNINWQWIFYVNIPVGAIAAFCVSTFVRESPRYGKGKRIDWWGILFLAIAVGSLQVVLEKGEDKDWFSTWYISLLTLSTIVAVICFIWREISIDFPIVNFKILRHRSFSIGIFTSFVLGVALYGSTFVFPVFTQNLLGFTAAQTGLILLPGGLATISMMPFVGNMLKRGIPAQILSAIGFFLFFVFCYMLFGSNLNSGTGDFFWPLIIRGVGMAVLFVPLTTLAIQDLRGPEIGQGTGLNNMMRQLGGSFGIAIITTIIHIKSGINRAVLLENVNIYNPEYQARNNAAIQNFMSNGFSRDQAIAMANGAMEGNITKQTMLTTFNDVYLLVGFFVLLCIPLIFLQKFSKKPVAMPTDAH
ncbi:DHA2 family efflux MFS transporter permease subunit [Dinghuibacter silviterrae]|uniref:DHA2 family multidrug resistance protein n=1 Tax=Dinghuibacter silviterrae TaxID=1539049 RepID=A0A4R8DN04_9BACT|nr:DHA2 family efflux MFS transporter permease subunit [Dinghuibacter silviterrae]TDW99391.1 DHA2 family multidrug resistance protein [Dinghuibacter silviterrae]